MLAFASSDVPRSGWLCRKTRKLAAPARIIAAPMIALFRTKVGRVQPVIGAAGHDGRRLFGFLERDRHIGIRRKTHCLALDLRDQAE